MNPFTMSFDTRLAEWYDLRRSVQDSGLEELCIAVDKFWQQCPLTNYYLHIYTLAILGIKEVDLAIAIDYTDTEVVLVLVDNAKYVLNYWPNSVVNTELSDFKNVKYIDIKTLYNKQIR